MLRKAAALVAALALAMMVIAPATAVDPTSGPGTMGTSSGVAGMPPGMPPMKAFDQTKRQAAAKANVAKGVVNNMQKLTTGKKGVQAAAVTCPTPSTTIIDYSGTCVPNYANSSVPGGGGPSVTFGGPGTGAVAIATVGAGGAITGVSVTSGGTGYTSIPSVAFGGAGTGAIGTAVVTGGVKTVTLTNGGSGFTAAPITFSGGGKGPALPRPPPSSAVSSPPSPLTAAGTGYTSGPDRLDRFRRLWSSSDCDRSRRRHQRDGRRLGLYGPGRQLLRWWRDGRGSVGHRGPGRGRPDRPVGTAGAGYTAPSVSFTGTGAGAGGTATGVVDTITVTGGGAGYVAPQVVFTGGGASTPATATATVAGGVITGIVINTPGVGYTSAPAISFTDTATPTTVAVATATISVTAVTVTSGGAGYTAAPSVLISDTGVPTTQALATATVSPSNVITGFTITNPGAATPALRAWQSPARPGAERLQPPPSPSRRSP